MNEELKPCPFCGSLDLRMQNTDANHGYDGDVHIACNNCCSTGRKYYPNEPQKAIKAWNRRACMHAYEDLVLDVPAIVYCTKCKKDLNG